MRYVAGLTASFFAAAAMVFTPALGSAQTSSSSATSDKVERKADQATDTMKDAAQDMKDKTKDTAQDVKDKAHDMKEKVKEKSHQTADKARDLKDRAKDKLHSKSDKADRTDRMEGRGEHKRVRDVQQALKDKGFDPGPVDGIQGPQTTAALKAYQKAEGLEATGRVDQRTITKLNLPEGATPGSSSRTPETPTPGSMPSTSSTPGATGTPSTTPEKKSNP